MFLVGTRQMGQIPVCSLAGFVRQTVQGTDVCYTAWNELSLPIHCGYGGVLLFIRPLQREVAISLNWEGCRGWLIGSFVCLFHSVLPYSGDNLVTWRRMYINNKAKQLQPSALYLVTVGYLFPHHWEDAPSLLDSVCCQTWRNESLDFGLVFVLSVYAA